MHGQKYQPQQKVIMYEVKQTYIKDKIKQPSEECAFKLFAVDIV
jgi:hypothetical protein